MSKQGRVLRTMPHSEVCMHMKVAGKQMLVENVAGMAQLYEPDTEKKFSAPITWGEAGVTAASFFVDTEA